MNKDLVEEIQALLSEAFEAAGSDDRDRLVSILDEMDPLMTEGLDLTTRVRQLLETDSAENL